MGNTKPQNFDTPLSTLDDIADRIQIAADRCNDTLGRLNALGDRAFGPQPEEAEGKSCGASVALSGAVDRIYVALGRLDGMTAKLAAAQDRINDLA